MDDLKKFNHRMQHNYTRNLIHREPNFEIMLVCWPPHISAPIHGHEGEKCWARVQTGKLNICNYKEVSRNPLKLEKIQELECAPGFLDGPADIHSVENLSDSSWILLLVPSILKGSPTTKRLGFHSPITLSNSIQ